MMPAVTESLNRDAADRIGIDPTLGGAGVVLMLCIAVGLISIFRHPVPAQLSSAPAMATGEQKPALTA